MYGEVVVHVIQQTSNPNDVSINASAVPGHQEMEVERWGPRQLSNLECQGESRTNTSQDSSQSQ